MTVNEGDSSAQVGVTLDNAVAGGFTVTAATANGTATEGEDYTETTTNLAFDGTPGQTVNLTVPITDDDTVEGSETFTVSLSGLAGTDLTVVITDTGTVTINPDANDTAQLTVGDVTVNEDAGTAAVIVTLDNPVSGGFMVTAATASGTATAGNDYTETSETLDFTDNETQTLTVPIADDSIVEGSETFTVSLSGLAGTSLTVDISDTATVTITDNDTAQLTVGNVTVDEDADTAQVGVTLNNAVAGNFTVMAATENGTATAGEDYTETSETLTFDGTQGQTVNLTVPISNDDIVEGSETFTVSLSGLAGTDLTVDITDIGTVTITDNDSAQLTVQGVTVNEGDGSAAVEIVSSGGTVPGGFTVTAFTNNGTAAPEFVATADVDYTAISQVLTFAGNEDETQTLTVQITDDDIVEGGENFTVSLSGLTGTATVDISSSARVRILDNDSAVLTVADVTVDEGADSAEVQVTLDNAVKGDGFTVTAATVNGTAIAGDDFESASEILTFTGSANEMRTLTVPITDDSIFEGGETFTVSLSGLAGTTANVVITGSGTVTITDDDTARVTVGDVTVDEDVGRALVVVRLNQAVMGGFTVTVSIAEGGTATAGEDYRDNLGTFDFRVGGNANDALFLLFPITDDSIVEGLETFTVSLSGLRDTAFNVDITDTGTVTITDNDVADLTVGDVTVDENAGTAEVEVSLDNAVEGGFMVTASTTNGGTATEGDDYTETSEILTFEGSVDEIQTLTVPITDDSIVEGGENFTVSLSVLADTTANVVITDTATVTITDDDSARLTVGNVTVNEGDGSAEVGVTLDNTVEGGFTVMAVTANGTATAGDDYTAIPSQVLTFTGTANQTVNLTVPITDDSTVEGSETFTVSLSVLAGTTANVVITDTGTVTINSDTNDTAQLTIGNVTVNENAGTAQVGVTLDNAVSGGFTVTAATAEGTATADDDYTETTTELTFTGSASETQTLTVPITDDSMVEGGENFTVSLSSLAGTSLTVVITDTATVTITDDDTAQLTVGDVTVDEGADSAEVQVTLDNAVKGGGFTVTAATANGTAIAGEDFESTSETLTFTGSANETRTLTVPITDDSIVEEGENFTVSLSGLAGTSLTVGITSIGTVTITDNDSAQLTVGNVTVNEGAGTAEVGVTLDNTVEGGFTVTAATANGTATAGDDYTAIPSQVLTFTGSESERQILTVQITDDAIVEVGENFTVTLSSVAGTSLTVGINSIGTVTITDNDTAQLTVGDVTVNEGDGSAEVGVTLNNAVEGGFTVTAATANGTATAGDDYTAIPSQVLTFTGSESERQILTVQIDDDSIVEGSETFTVSLTGLSGATNVDTNNTGTVTITDNDSAQLTVGDVTVNEGAGSLDVEVSLNNAVEGGFMVTAATANGTAIAGEDYTAIPSQVLTFTDAANQTVTLTVQITEDDIVEGGENFTVSLSGLAGTTANVVITDTGTVTITDNDTAQLTVGNVTVDEGTDSAEVVVTLNNAVTGGFTVTAATDSGTATADEDYTETSETLTFTGSVDETQTLTVPITDDDIVEGSENFTVSLSGLSGATNVVYNRHRNGNNH